MGCGQEVKKNYYCEFIKLTKMDESTYSLDFKSDEIKVWQAGDHSMLILNVNDTLVGKKLSYVTMPEENIIRFTTRIKEKGSDYKRALLDLIKGEFVKISEPSGNFTLRRENRPVVLLSNGVGVSGVVTMVKQFIDDQSKVSEMLLMNVDNSSDIYKEDFKQFESEVDTFKSYYLSHRASYYGMLKHELTMMNQRHQQNPIFYLTGSDIFVNESVKYLKDLDYLEADIVLGGKQADSCCRD